MKGILSLVLLASLSAACMEEQPHQRPWGPPQGYPQQQYPAQNQTQPPPPGQPAPVFQPIPRPHPAVAYGAGVAVHATSPAWMSVSYLGAPLDANFQPLRGAAAALPVFSGGALPQAPVKQFESDLYQADKQLEFGANVSTWVVDASVQYDSSTRFLSQRARYVDSAIELNERSAMNQPPQGAVWYVGKIYFGGTYDEILFAHDTQLTSSVAASFFSIGGDIHGFAASHQLQERTIIRGMNPNGQALFAHSPADVQHDFTLTTSSYVPIMVEYRSIPNMYPKDGPILWR